MGLAADWIGGLDELPGEWDALAERHPDPYMRRSWLTAWFDAFGDGGEPAICCVWRGAELVAGAPFVRRGHRLQTMANVESPIYRPLAADDAACDALWDALGRAPVRALLLEQLVAGEATTEALARRLRAAGWLVALEPTFDSPLVETGDGDFDAYKKARGSDWKNLERLNRKVRRERDVVARVMELPEEGVGYLDEGFRLEAAGWKGAEGTAILARPPMERFYRAVAADFAARGELSLSGLWIDGRLAAYKLGALTHERYWQLKSAYDEELRSLSPGRLLIRQLTEESFRRKLRAYELLGVDEPYKLKFATGVRHYVACRAYAPRPASLPVWGWRRVRPSVRTAYRAARDAGMRERIASRATSATKRPFVRR